MRFNQFIIAPYIGDGSPVDQTMWVDNLTVATSRTGGGTPSCTDNDGDGYGVGSGCNGPDCDDNDNNRNPGNTELCTGGVDEDCDNLVDCADADCSSDPLCQCIHDADIPPCDGMISITELIDYIDRWKAGEVSLQVVMGAIVEWKG